MHRKAHSQRLQKYSARLTRPGAWKLHAADTWRPGSADALFSGEGGARDAVLERFTDAREIKQNRPKVDLVTIGCYRLAGADTDVAAHIGVALQHPGGSWLFPFRA